MWFIDENVPTKNDILSLGTGWIPLKLTYKTAACNESKNATERNVYRM